MATKEFHQFDDKTALADIESVADFELLASKAGNNGINIPLSSLKTWVMTGDVGAGGEYNVKAAVDTLKVALTTSVLTLNGKTLTSSADRITANTDLYSNNNKLAQEGTAPTFTDVTANQVQAATGQNDRASFAQNLIKVFVGGVEAMKVERGGGVNTVTFSGNVAMGAHDLTTAGALTAGQFKGGASGFTFSASEGSVKASGNVLTVRNRTTNGCELELNLAAFNFRSTGIYGNQTLIGIETDSGEANPAEIRFYEKGGAINVSSNHRGRILSKGDNLEVKRGSAKATFTDTSGLYGKITLDAGTSNPAGDANSGVRLGATTDLYLNAARKLSWRYATASQDGLMSAAQAAQINKIAAIEEANGNLTQELGFQTVSDGTNTRTATSQDRILNIVSESGDLTVTVDTDTQNAELKLNVTNQMVKLATAQTLTNKTLLSATNVIEATKLHTTEISTTAPTDNQILKFDSVSGKWQPEDEIAQSGDPVFTKGSIDAPSISFQGTRGSTSGIFHKETGTPPLDGVAIVQDGVRSALFSKDGVTIDNSMLLGKHIWAGVNRTTEITSDLVFRTGSGIRGNTLRKSIIFKCAQLDVAEFSPDMFKLNTGLSLKIRFLTDDETLSASDSVVLCSANCKTVTLPQAKISAGQLVIIGAGEAAGSSQAIGGAAATAVDIIGHSSDGGITRDAVDGKSSGVKITSNETAMLLCDGKKWMRLGGVGPSVGTSSPAEDAGFTKLMLSFGRTQNYTDNPSGAVQYPALNTTFSKANLITTSTSQYSLKDADTSSPAEVTYEPRWVSGVFTGAGVTSQFKESYEFFWVAASLALLESGTDANYRKYFTLNDLPAGSYSLLVLGGYPNYQFYDARVIVTEADAFTPGVNDVAYSSEAIDPVGSYIKTDNVRVLGDSGSTVSEGKVFQASTKVGEGFAHTTFTVGSKQNVRFYVTQGQKSNVYYASLHAVYLVKTA